MNHFAGVFVKFAVGAGVVIFPAAAVRVIFAGKTDVEVSTGAAVVVRFVVEDIVVEVAVPTIIVVLAGNSADIAVVETADAFRVEVEIVLFAMLASVIRFMGTVVVDTVLIAIPSDAVVVDVGEAGNATRASVETGTLSLALSESDVPFGIATCIILLVFPEAADIMLFMGFGGIIVKSDIIPGMVIADIIPF